VKQLPLFDLPILPSRPFPRYSRKTDEVRICSRCRREIVIRRDIRGQVVAEYVSAAGECFRCHSARA
jgi:hypothetical protein